MLRLLHDFSEAVTTRFCSVMLSFDDGDVQSDLTSMSKSNNVGFSFP